MDGYSRTIAVCSAKPRILLMGQKRHSIWIVLLWTYKLTHKIAGYIGGMCYNVTEVPVWDTPVLGFVK